MLHVQNCISNIWIVIGFNKGLISRVFWKCFLLNFHIFSSGYKGLLRVVCLFVYLFVFKSEIEREREEKGMISVPLKKYI